MHARAVEHGIGLVELALAEIVVLAVLAVDRRGVAGHRAVEIDRQIGNAVVALEHLQEVDQLLRPADGERRDQHHAAALDRALDDARQRVEDRAVGMIAIAVGAFADEVVARRRRGGIVVERAVVAADVAGEQNPQRRRAVADFDFDHVRAEQMAGVVVAHPDRLGGREPLAALGGAKQLHRLARRRGRRRAAARACASSSPCGWRSRRPAPGTWPNRA